MGLATEVFGDFQLILNKDPNLKVVHKVAL